MERLLTVLAVCGCACGAAGAPALEPELGWVDAPVADAGRVDAGAASDAGLRQDAGSQADAGLPATPRGAQARALVADGGRLVDVRTAGEFAQGHLEGARNLPLGELAARQAELEPRAEWVIVYCRSGARSAQAAAWLGDAGFPRVFDLGALTNW